MFIVITIIVFLNHTETFQDFNNQKVCNSMSQLTSQLACALQSIITNNRSAECGV